MKKYGAVFAGIIGIILVMFGIDSKGKKAISVSVIRGADMPASVSVIGGADGPTSVFLAGNLGSDFSNGMIATGIIFIILMIILLKRNKK